MGKKVNVHVKATGTEQVKRKLDGVTSNIRKAGTQSEKTGGLFAKMGASLGNLINGPIGFVALGTAAAVAAKKIIQFFDDAINKLDQFVAKTENFRKTLDDVFEATGSFSEKKRKNVSKNIARLAFEQSAPFDLTTDVANAYRRQFGDVLGGDDFAKGRAQALSFAVRHGGSQGAVDAISLARGFGINTVQGQGDFFRQISATAAQSGLTDAEVIEALGKGKPAVEALGLSPVQALSFVGQIAAGQTGRKKRSLPGTTFEGLANPSEESVKALGLNESATPKQIFDTFLFRSQSLNPDQQRQLAFDVYGPTAALGVLTLVRGGQKKSIDQAIQLASSPAGISANQQEINEFKGTLEAIANRTNAAKKIAQLEQTPEEFAGQKLREFGKQQQELFQGRRPIRQFFKELVVLGENKEKDQAVLDFIVESFPDTPEGRRGAAQAAGKFRNANNVEALNLLNEAVARKGKPAARLEKPPVIPEIPVEDSLQDHGGNQSTIDPQPEPLSRNTTIINYHNDINYFRPEGQAAARVGTEDVA